MFSYHPSQVLWSESKTSLTDAFTDMLEVILEDDLGACRDVV